MIYIKSLKLSEYKSIKEPNKNIIYYINNTKGKHIFYKGGVRHHSCRAFFTKEVPKQGDVDFRLNTILFNPITGLAIKYNDVTNYTIIQNEWAKQPLDNVTFFRTVDNLSESNDEVISSGLEIFVVKKLPTTNIKNGLYLVKRADAEEGNIFEEYLYVENSWELVGSSHINIDGMVTETILAEALKKYYTSEKIKELFVLKNELEKALMNYYTTEQIDEMLSNLDVDLTDYYSKEEIDNNFFNKDEITELLKALNPDAPDLTGLVTQSGLEKILKYYAKLDYLEKNYYNKIEIDELLKNVNVDLSEYTTFQDVEDLINTISVDLSGYYDKQDIDDILTEYLRVDRLDDYYNKSEIDDLLNGVTIDLSGYYTSEEVDKLLEDIKNTLDNYYNKQDIDSKFYSITQINENFFNKDEITDLLKALNPNGPDLTGFVTQGSLDKLKNELTINFQDVDKSEISDYYNKIKKSYYSAL